MHTLASLRKAATIGIASLSLLTALSGCGGDDKPAGPSDSVPGTGTYVEPLNTPWGDEIYTWGETNLSGVLATSSHGSSQFLDAEFFDDSISAYAGAVTVNGNKLDTSSYPPYYNYFSYSSGFPGVRFDGSNHSWNVAGKDNQPAFTGAVASPSTFPVISTPASNATVSPTQPLVISWSAGTPDVLITLYQLDEGYNTTAYRAIVVNGNSFTIEAAKLQGFKSGKTRMNISSINRKVVTAEGKRYLLLAETYAPRHIYFQ